MQFIFSHDAEKEFSKLDKTIQRLVITKLQKIKQGGGHNIKPLVNMYPYTHRLRVENYRLLLAECKEGFEVLSVGHRGEIYT